MHTSFTGSARKARQVNLSGRNVANPWANLPGAQKSSQSFGSQNTVANAQADRLRRQQERDRINSVRRIQKTWRGHSVRRKQKQKWREEWDYQERMRLHIKDTIYYDDLSVLTLPNLSYSSKSLCLAQLRLLLHFCNVKDRIDAKRLLFFGHALQESLNKDPSLAAGIPVLSTRKLERLIAQYIDHTASISAERHVADQTRIGLLQLGIFVAKLASDEVCKDASLHFSALSHCLQASTSTDTIQSSISEYVTTILSRFTSLRTHAYTAFVEVMLSSPELIKLPSVLRFLQDAEPQRLLADAVVSVSHSETSKGDNKSTASTKNIWQLFYLLHIRQQSTHFNTAFDSWLQALSSLLSRCANELARRSNVIDESSAGGNTSGKVTPLPSFVMEQIYSLSEQSSVKQILQELHRTEGQYDNSVPIMAKPLANYALALLRAFPHKATNIRMWLYRSSPSSSKASLSTIQYLWQAAQITTVFQRILRDHRSVMSVLVEAAPEHNQIGRTPVSEQQVATWQEEWRIILLFLELYTFILKIMDDEEFFALADTGSFAANSKSMSQFSQGALPLNDIASMTTFLKNLAFPLYWNAADLAESNEIEEAGGLSALFGTSSLEVPRHTEKTLPTLAGNGVSHMYLKERVTGLLRMLHERDSRRTFLPATHWLMTSHVDMQGFITSVVAEEEKRHQIQEEDEIEEIPDEDLLDAEEPEQSMDVVGSLSSMFGIRPPHMSRPQTSRLNDMLDKRREQAKKRRQAESLVPRLEILRNLPFFIPFETRVQIFREFVFQDQMRRRNGWVDPDDWRVSVASATQGRMDGRPVGIDRVNRHHANIHRESVFEDAFEEFYDLGEELKEPIQISFIDQFGSPEAGIDGGGVTKEFLMSVTAEAFDPHSEMPMFVENDQHYLYPNPKMLEWNCEALRRNGLKSGSEQFNQNIRDLLQRYEFLGRVVGKCMYEGILVDLNFAGFFLLKWALTGGTTSATRESAYRASINDLRDFDEEFYQGLLKLKNYTGDVESDFSLNFEVSDEMELSNGTKFTWTRELEHNGKDVPVTKTNRLRYIDRITRYRLQQQPAQVTNAFLKGLGQIIQPMWLAMFNQRELQKLVGGDNAELDINDLRRNTHYGGLYVIGDDGLEHPTVALFWKVLKDMSDADRRKVLKFVTSTPRAPLLGFSHLNPKFSIRDSSEDQTRLPSTSTCVNLLKLPRYGDERTMREKLLYAVSSGAGFDLS